MLYPLLAAANHELRRRVSRTRRLVRETALLASCSAVLGWDEQTYMPKGASEHRGSQMAILAGIHHERNVAADW